MKNSVLNVLSSLEKNKVEAKFFDNDKYRSDLVNHHTDQSFYHAKMAEKHKNALMSVGKTPLSKSDFKNHIKHFAAMENHNEAAKAHFDSMLHHGSSLTRSVLKDKVHNFKTKMLSKIANRNSSKLGIN